MITLNAFDPLSTAEVKLLETCSIADRTSVGDGSLPADETDDNRIRAELLRHLLLTQNGDLVLHPKGLRLRGAFIVGHLDLQGCDIGRDISLTNCRIKNPITLVNARLRGFYISGSRICGISADNADFAGSVFLRAQSYVSGEISLAGATIKGDLQFCEITLNSETQDAVFAPSLTIEGSMFLGNYPYSGETTDLISNATLFFSSARVTHDVFVTNTAISLSQDILGDGVFGATEEHGRDMALSFARAKIDGLLFFQDNQINQGIVNLAGATVRRLKDEPAGPGANYPIRLDGFRYTDFSRHTDTSLGSRLAWLERRPNDTPFTAQPYEHLARVMTAMGHRSDATGVLIRKEKLLRRENRSLMASTIGKSPRWALSAISDTVLWATVGFGYRPGRAVIMAVMLIIGLGVFFDKTWKAGDFAPNAAPILISASWISATETHPHNPAAFWSQPGQAGQDWETFNAYAYAADLVVPLVSLGQESTWAPSTSRSPLGKIAWWLRWISKALGWVVTALLAAAITGVIRQE